MYGFLDHDWAVFPLDIIQDWHLVIITGCYKKACFYFKLLS